MIYITKSRKASSIVKQNQLIVMQKIFMGVVLLFTTLLIFPSYGQSYLQFQGSSGELVGYSENMEPLKGSRTIFKLDYATVLNTKDFHHMMNNPLAGVSLTYIDHGNQATGNSLSLSGFLQPTIVGGERHDLSGRVSVGLAYVQNPYDVHENPLQQAIGTNVNFFVEGQLIYTYDLTNRFDLQLISGISHISNGARRLPNTGFNILSLGVGARYKLSDQSASIIPAFNSPEVKYDVGSFSHYAIFRGGIKSMRNLGNRVFPVVGLNYTLAYRYHPLGSFTGGLDVDYNEGFVRERMALNDAQEGYDPFTSWRWGAAIGHELHMNKVSLITQYAFYLRKPHPTHSIAYQRYGLKYQIGAKTSVALTLRAHGGRADYMEWTVGRKLW